MTHKRFSQMTPDELKEVMEDCQRKGLIAYEEDRINELSVLRMRYYLAASYLLDPADFAPGESYYVEGEEGLFTLTHIDGIMGHGQLSGSPFAAAFPLAMLSRDQEPA